MIKIPKNIKCVIFDMDGVIIDSEELHKKAYYETFNALNVEVSDTLYKSFTGSSTINAFQKLVAHFDLKNNPEELVLDKRKRYVNFFENAPNLRLVAGVAEIIGYLYEKGITLILASSSAMINIDRVFNRFHLNQYFTAKISGADLKESKPNPEIFNKAAILANIQKENCVIIEDSDNGVTAANNANIFVFGYANKLSEGQTLENADFVITHFNQLNKWVKKKSSY
jgi:HAD superfamily hydrolase (TIGR01509 family)